MELRFENNLVKPAAGTRATLIQPVIHRFWAHAFGDYNKSIPQGLGFHVPRFPGPLYSPNFVLSERPSFLAANRGLLPHFNEVILLGHDQRSPAPVGYRLSKQFFLGERKLGPNELPAGFTAELLPLREAVKLNSFWRLITDGFLADAPFLRMLLPFLTTLEADFQAAFLNEGKERVGVIIVGVAGGAALAMSKVVDSRHRGRGFSSILAELAQNLAYENGATDAFFWTEHAFLGKHADLVRHYRIFERA